MSVESVIKNVPPEFTAEDFVELALQAIDQAIAACPVHYETHSEARDIYKRLEELARKETDG